MKAHTSRKASLDRLSPREQYYYIFPSLLKNWAEQEKVSSQNPYVQNCLNIFIETYQNFLETNITPELGYQSLRQLYCLTDGKFNQFWQKLYGIFHPQYKFPNLQGCLGDLERDSLSAIVKNIQETGFHIFEKKLPDAICDRLIELARKTPCKLNPTPPSGIETAVYDRQNPLAPTYYISEQTLLDCDDIQNLVSDFSLLAVAQSYLGGRVTPRNVSLWWSTPLLQGQASSESAQLYHWDGDAIKFINFFVYLTDVTSENGPHCYVQRSHLSKPASLLRDGRFSDAEIDQQYPSDSRVEILGSRGTIVAADTRGFHKGKPVLSGERLMLQMTMATCLFGAPYNTIQLHSKCNSTLAEAARQFPHTYSRFLGAVPAQHVENQPSIVIL
jgi:Phytanoyl-CoA dioxygenase (PhyH)